MDPDLDPGGPKIRGSSGSGSGSAILLVVTSLSRIFSQDQVRRLRELSGLRIPYMRPSVRAVIDPETLEEAVLSAVIKHLALGTVLRRKEFYLVLLVNRNRRNCNFSYYIQHYFICRPSDSTVPTDAGIKPRTVATGALAVRRSNH